uniref:Ig-like domain-containing protein n=1 Tax=Chelonoidis abingdonii TaxID=106734 RepID=A0A8C0G5S7_CHEAB
MGSPRLYMGSQNWSASEEAGTLKVRQDPAQILAPLGGSVELSCQINTTQRWKQLRVEWQRDRPLTVFCQVVLNNTSVSNCCRGLGVCDDARLSFTWHPPKFTLRMGNISEDDVGWYMCKAIVEIPVYLDAMGNGTMLNISGRGAGALPGQRGERTCNSLLVGSVTICAGRQPLTLFASSEMKQTSLYIQEFQRSGHNWKPPVTERSPGPTKASKKASSFKQRHSDAPMSEPCPLCFCGSNPASLHLDPGAASHWG